jgi:hypothetical protein
MKQKKEDKTAYIVYLMVKGKTLSKYHLRRKLKPMIGYTLRYEEFIKKYDEALLVLQESNVTFDDDSISSSKAKQAEKKDSKNTIQQEYKHDRIADNFYDDSFRSEEPLFVEDYSLKNESNNTQTVHDEIDELFSTPTAEFQTVSPLEQNNEAKEKTSNSDYTNDKEEVPEIFETSISGKSEVVSDTNLEITNGGKKLFDKSKVKRKKDVQKKSVEIIDKNIGDGWKYYDFMDTKVWFDLDKCSSHIKKELRVTDENDFEYMRDWYANLLLLNVYYNELFEKENTKLLEQLKEHGIEEDKYGAPVLKNIHRKYSNFEEFSQEYPDFKNSKSIKDEDIFWIITEWEKGTATRKYLDYFIGKIKRTILEEFDGVSEKDIDAIIDTALMKWERDITDVRTRSDNFQFVGNEVHELHYFDYLQGFLPEKVLLNYEPPMNIDDDFSLLLSRPQGDSIYERIVEIAYVLARSKIDDSKTRLWKMNMKIYKDEELERFWTEEIFLIKDGIYGTDDLLKNREKFRDAARTIQRWNAQINFRNYQNGIKYKDFIKKQEKWVFEYNKNILESKKQIIIQELEESGISI